MMISMFKPKYNIITIICNLITLKINFFFFFFQISFIIFEGGTHIYFQFFLSIDFILIKL